MVARVPFVAILLVAASMAVAPASTADAFFAGDGPEAGGEPLVWSNVLLPGATLQNLGGLLGTVSWEHPLFGQLQITAVRDMSPVVEEVGWYDASENLVIEVPVEYILSGLNQNAGGRIGVASNGGGGYLLTDMGDVEIVAEWVQDGLLLRMGGASPGGGHQDDVENLGSFWSDEDANALDSDDVRHGELLDPLWLLLGSFGIQAIHDNAENVSDPLASDLGAGPTARINDDLFHGDDSESSASHNHGPGQCASLQATIGTIVDGAEVDCGQVEEDLPDIPIGDDYETLVTPLSTTATAPEGAAAIKVRVYHEGKLARANSDCMFANDRIFEEEAAIPLVCSVIGVPIARHDSGTGNGYQDWLNFRADYFGGKWSYKSGTEAYNGGRFVAFLPNEHLIQTSSGTWAGLARDCGSPTWETSTSSSPCGHMVVYNKQNGNYWRHSEAYREGQTFAHEVIHLLNVRATGHTGHDDTVHAKNYNGKEFCSGRGNDFWSHNVFFWNDNGSPCDHRHYWLATEDNVEQNVNSNALIHNSKYRDSPTLLELA